MYEGVWRQDNLKAMKTISVNPLSYVQTMKFHFLVSRTLLLEGIRNSEYFVTKTAKKRPI